MKKCVFAGSFDPPTVGHTEVIEKALKIFDCVTVALMVNPQKKCLFSAEERLALLNKLYGGNDRVEVKYFTGAAVDVLREENTLFYVRGIRDGLDLDYENRDRLASEKLMPGMLTVYIPSSMGNLYVSSSLVRASVAFKKEFTDYLPPEIRGDVLRYLEAKNV